ncbi:MAG: GAF and ANTAR domain-containing protein [Lapillicoccus sp.]
MPGSAAISTAPQGPADRPSHEQDGFVEGRLLPEATRPAAMFDRLAEVIYAATEFGQVYEAIVDAATRLVDGCDHASLMIENRGVFATVAASDDVARAVDGLERIFGQGPCLDAIMEDEPQLEPDLVTMSPWPELGRAIVSETPVRGGAGFRMVVGGVKVGALNLFSDRAGALTEASVDQGIILASFAAVAITAVRDREQAASLSQGLASNREIGKAIGLMMAFHKVSDTQAFDLLRRASQDMNLKLAEVARQVIDHHNTGNG